MIIVALLMLGFGVADIVKASRGHSSPARSAVALALSMASVTTVAGLSDIGALRTVVLIVLIGVGVAVWLAVDHVRPPEGIPPGYQLAVVVSRQLHHPWQESSGACHCGQRQTAG